MLLDEHIDAETAIHQVELSRILYEGLAAQERGEGMVMDDATLRLGTR